MRPCWGRLQRRVRSGAAEEWPEAEEATRTTRTMVRRGSGSRRVRSVSIRSVFLKVSRARRFDRLLTSSPLLRPGQANRGRCRLESKRLDPAPGSAAGVSVEMSSQYIGCSLLSDLLADEAARCPASLSSACPLPCPFLPPLRPSAYLHTAHTCTIIMTSETRHFWQSGVEPSRLQFETRPHPPADRGRGRAHLPVPPFQSLPPNTNTKLRIAFLLLCAMSSVVSFLRSSPFLAVSGGLYVLAALSWAVQPPFAPSSLRGGAAPQRAPTGDVDYETPSDIPQSHHSGISSLWPSASDGSAPKSKGLMRWKVSRAHPFGPERACARVECLRADLELSLMPPCLGPQRRSAAQPARMSGCRHVHVSTPSPSSEGAVRR